MLKLEREHKKALKERNDEKEIAAENKRYDLAVESIQKKKVDDEKEADAKYGKLGAGSELLSMVEGLGGPIGGMASTLGKLAGGPLTAIPTILSGIAKIVSAGFKTLDQGVEMYANMQQQYSAQITARLAGSSQNFSQFYNRFKDTFGSNMYISQKGLIEKLSSLVESGISYNLEQRSILAELSDRMVTTFDMLDATLLRLTRIQQTDMSTASLGSEAILTKFLNQQFNDTGYLSDVYDTVNSTLLEAVSQMSYDQSTEFTYNVQKWLGSLYALGMSSSGVTTLAEGINALATGDIDYFNGNNSARTLFAMASSGSFSDLLVNGLNAQNVNQLLGNIVNYLASISTDTNLVTKKVKAGVFGGLSLSDIRSVANMSQSDYSAISNSSATWSSSLSKVDSLINYAQQITPAASLVQNMLDNTLLSMGQHLVESDTHIPILGDTNKYVAWKLKDYLPGLLETVATLLLGVTEVPNMVETVYNAYKTFNGNVATTNLAGTNLSVIEALVSPDRLIRDRGSSYAGTAGVLSGISTSTAVNLGNSAASIGPASISGASEVALSQALYDQAVTIGNAAAVNQGYNETLSRSINDLYKALFEEQRIVRVTLAEVEEAAQISLIKHTYNVADADDTKIIDKLNRIDTSINTKLTTTNQKLDALRYR